jgi:hypothetical protein
MDDVLHVCIGQVTGILRVVTIHAVFYCPEIMCYMFTRIHGKV